VGGGSGGSGGAGEAVGVCGCEDCLEEGEGAGLVHHWLRSLLFCSCAKSRACACVWWWWWWGGGGGASRGECH